jgi:hypothetical protein
LRLVQAETYDAVQANEELKSIWQELSPPLMSRSEDAGARPLRFAPHVLCSGNEQNRVDEAIKRAMVQLEKAAS